MAATAYPHLTDTESVRREAASQHGSLTDAAAFLQAQKARQSPDVAAASLRPINDEETKKLQEDPSQAQSKVDEAMGEGYTVIAAVVRGNALSTIVEDQYGATSHFVTGWTDDWKSVGQGEEQVNAEAAAAQDRLSGEVVAEIERRIEEAAAKIREEVAELYAKAQEKVNEVRQERMERIQERQEEGGDGEAEASVSASAARGRRSQPSPEE